MASRRVLERNGMVFEHTIVRYLQHHYPEAEFMGNLSIYSAWLGNVTQIDTIMVHPKGVFVIEAKGWRKWVKGNYDDEMWTGQSSGVETLTVFNPLHQNTIHIRTLRNAIRLETGQDIQRFENIVVFPDGTRIDSYCTEVCNLSSLCALINSAILKRGTDVNVQKMVKLIDSVTE